MARKKPSETAKARAEAHKRRVPVDLTGDPEMDSTLMDEVRRISPFKGENNFSDVVGGSSSTAGRKGGLMQTIKNAFRKRRKK